MFYRYLDHIKSRPDHHRRNYALGFSAVITAAIFLVWLSVMLPNSATQIIAEKSSEQPVVEGETPVVTLKRGVGQAFDAITGLFKSATDKSVNLQTEYDKMKNQVQSGEIKVVPENNLEQGY